MHLRRSTALALGVVLLGAPVLSSCGFNYATDRVYTPAMGANNRDAAVDVLGAVIVSAQDDAGTFIASFANNDRAAAAKVVSITAAGTADVQSGDFAPVSIPAGGLVNLASDGGIALTGTFKAGNFLPLTVTFGDGSRVTLNVPVVPDGGHFAGLDTSGDATVPATPTESGTAEPATPEASPSESPEA